MEEKIIRKIFEWLKLLSQHLENLIYIKFFLFVNLSTLFHAYWSKGNEDKDYKFVENEKIKRKEILLL